MTLARHTHILTAASAAALLCLPGLARAGEQLTVAQLAERSDSAVVVRVALGKPRPATPPSIELVRPLAGAPVTATPDPSWFGLCLPTRDLLTKWTRQHPRWPARKWWRQALTRGHYEAVVFLASRAGRPEPSCEVEAMHFNQTDLSPGYASYQTQVSAAFRDRPPKKPPTAP